VHDEVSKDIWRFCQDGVYEDLCGLFRLLETIS